MQSWRQEEGQALAEYGWTIVLVAILIITILLVLGLVIYDLWDVIAQAWADIWAGI